MIHKQRISNNGSAEGGFAVQIYSIKEGQERESALPRTGGRQEGEILKKSFSG
jgi:hypothetical protein